MSEQPPIPAEQDFADSEASGEQVGALDLSADERKRDGRTSRGQGDGAIRRNNTTRDSPEAGGGSGGPAAPGRQLGRLLAVLGQARV